jgi:hypothetical protein
MEVSFWNRLNEQRRIFERKHGSFLPSTGLIPLEIVANELQEAPEPQVNRVPTVLLEEQDAGVFALPEGCASPEHSQVSVCGQHSEPIQSSCNQITTELQQQQKHFIDSLLAQNEHIQKSNIIRIS